jgi:uncharacterized MAPEG superfamily protein
VPEALLPYHPAILALGMFGFLYLVQLLVADITGITRSHTPGTPVEGGHDDFLFRAARAHANSAESVGAVILISGFAIAYGGSPAVVNNGMWAFLAFRIVHMLAYYLDVRILRSVAFALGTVALLVVFGAGVRAL